MENPTPLNKAFAAKLATLTDRELETLASFSALVAEASPTDAMPSTPLRNKLISTIVDNIGE